MLLRSGHSLPLRLEIEPDNNRMLTAPLGRRPS